MSIYTRRGDDGTTSLVGGSRIPKDDLRADTYGTLDEANSAIGVARSMAEDEQLRSVLRFVQQRLMNIASRTATPAEARGPETPGVSDDDVRFLERAIDMYLERTGGIEVLVVPGGCLLCSLLHIGRTVVRRAERRLVALDDVDGATRRFVNRLSDLLFAAALWANYEASRPETPWDPAATAPEI